MLPNHQYLTAGLDLHLPLIGVYDAPDPVAFKPLVIMPPRQRACIFEFYQDWNIGQTLQLTIDNYGCGGCGHWLWGLETRSRQGFIDFLVNKEGLKNTEELMGSWLDHLKPFIPVHPYLFIGPLKPQQYEYLKTVTFIVNPDQLSVLITGAQYFHDPGSGSPILAEFGSGCMEILPLLEGHEGPCAMIGATDMAMREYLPHDKLAFTVNKAMFEDLCRLDDHSFLERPFLKILKNSRGGMLDRKS